MKTLPETIRMHAQFLAEGGLLWLKEFLHLGSRAAVDRAMSRLTKEGKRLRVARGMYVSWCRADSGHVRRRRKRLWNQWRREMAKPWRRMAPPQPMPWGWTQQVPIREAYVTSGRTKKLRLGQSEVLVRHAARWMLALGTGPAGAAVRALVWMGPTHVRESLAALHQTLPAAEWRTLASTRAALPSWTARAIGEEAVCG
jgi:hypothetical protein